MAFDDKMKQNTFAGTIWRRFKRNKLAVAGAIIVIIFFVISFLAPIISPYEPNAQNLLERLSPPSQAHLFGTDELGRDVLSRVLWGSRISLKVGFVAVGIFILIGTVLGAISGYYGGWIDNFIMRLVDIMLCFPGFFLILMVIAMLEPNINYVMAVIGLVSWPGVARLVRAEFLKLKKQEFVEAAVALGLSDARIIFRHILPNAMAPVLVAATLGVASAILVESGLSFLGLGVQPPTSSWGNILTSGKDYLLQGAWWLSAFPGLAIFITVLSYNLLGEGLRDALDPRLK